LLPPGKYSTTKASRTGFEEMSFQETFLNSSLPFENGGKLHPLRKVYSKLMGI